MKFSVKYKILIILIILVIAAITSKCKIIRHNK